MLACAFLINDFSFAADTIKHDPSQSTLAVATQLASQEFREKYAAGRFLLAHDALAGSISAQIGKEMEVLGDKEWGRLKNRYLDISGVRDIRGYPAPLKLIGGKRIRVVGVTGLRRISGTVLPIILGGRHLVDDDSLCVISVDSQYLTDEKHPIVADILPRLIDQIFQWEYLRSILVEKGAIVSETAGMRVWIKAHIEVPDPALAGTEFAKLTSRQIARLFHQRSHPIPDSVYAEFAAKADFDYDYIRTMLSLYGPDEGSREAGEGYGVKEEANPAPEAPDGRPFHPVPEERDSRTLQEKCPDLEKRPDLRNAQAKPVELNAEGRAPEIASAAHGEAQPSRNDDMAGAFTGDETVTPADVEAVMKNAGRILTREEEQVVFRALHSPDDVISERLKMRILDFFVEHNQGLVKSVVKRYHRTDPSVFDEAVSDGNLGLVNAINRFDHTLGFKFSTYAQWHIGACIVKGAHALDQEIHIPENVTLEVNRLKRAVAKLANVFGREPSIAEIAEETKLPEYKIIDLMDIRKLKPASLDQERSSEDDRTLIETIPGDYGVQYENLSSLLACLAQVERIVIKLRFGIGTVRGDYSLEEVGGMLELTRERIRQIEAKALRKLRAEEARKLPSARRSVTDDDNADVYIVEVLRIMPKDKNFEKLLKSPRRELEARHDKLRKKTWQEEVESDAGLRPGELTADIINFIPERRWELMKHVYGIDRPKPDDMAAVFARLNADGFHYESIHAVVSEKSRILEDLKSRESGRENLALKIGIQPELITNEAIDRVPERLREVLCMRYGIGRHRVLRAEDISKRLAELGYTGPTGTGYARMTIRALMVRAERHLKDILMGVPYYETPLPSKKIYINHRGLISLGENLDGVRRTELGMRLLAKQAGIDEKAITRERLWMLTPMQLRLIQLYYGIDADPAPSMKALGEQLYKEGFHDAHAKGPLHPSNVARAKRSAIEYFGRYASGMEWLAHDVDITVPELKARIDGLSRIEWETVRMHYGVDCHKKASDIDILHALRKSRILGRFGNIKNTGAIRCARKIALKRLRGELPESKYPMRDYADDASGRFHPSEMFRRLPGRVFRMADFCSLSNLPAAAAWKAVYLLDELGVVGIAMQRSGRGAVVFNYIPGLIAGGVFDLLEAYRTRADIEKTAAAIARMKKGSVVEEPDRDILSRDGTRMRRVSPEAVAIHIETLFRADAERRSLPTQKELAKVFGMSRAVFGLHMEDVVARLERRGCPPDVDGRLREAIASWRVVHERENVRFDVEKAVRYILDLFVKDAGLKRLPTLEDLGRYTRNNIQTVSNNYPVVLAELERMIASGEITGPDAETFTKAIASWRAFHGKFKRFSLKRAAAYILRLFVKDPLRERLPGQRKMSAKLGWGVGTFSRYIEDLIKHLSETARSGVLDGALSARILKAVEFWAAQKAAAKLCDDEAAADYIIDAFRRDSSLKKAPVAEKIADALGQGKTTIRRRYDKIISIIRRRVAEPGFDEEIRSRLMSAIEKRQDLRNAQIKPIEQNMEGRAPEIASAAHGEAQPPRNDDPAVACAGIPFADYITYRNVLNAETDEAIRRKFDIADVITEPAKALERMRAYRSLRPARIDTVIMQQSADTRLQSVVELISNSLDATEKQKRPIGRFGVGGLQILSYVLDEKNPPLSRGGAEVTVDTKADGERARRIRFFKNDQGTLVFVIGDSPRSERGTVIRLRWASRPDSAFLDKMADYIMSKLLLNTRMPVYMNGRLINRLDGYLYLDGKALEYSTPSGRVDVAISEDGIEVSDSGEGMGEGKILDTYLIPREGRGIPQDIVTEEEADREIAFFYKSPAGDKHAKGTMKASLQVAGVRIQEFEIEGIGLPEELVLELPALSKLNYARNEVIIDEVTHVAIRLFARKLADPSRTTIHKDALINGFMALARELDRHNGSSTGGTLIDEARKVMVPWAQGEARSGLLVPNRAEFHEMLLPEKSRFFDEALIVGLHPLNLPGARRLENGRDFEPGTCLEAYTVPFKDDSLKSYVVLDNYLIVNAAIWKKHRRFPILLNLRLNFHISYGPRAPPKGRFLRRDEIKREGRRVKGSKGQEEGSARFSLKDFEATHPFLTKLLPTQRNMIERSIEYMATREEAAALLDELHDWLLTIPEGLWARISSGYLARDRAGDYSSRARGDTEFLNRYLYIFADPDKAEYVDNYVTNLIAHRERLPGLMAKPEMRGLTNIIIAHIKGIDNGAAWALDEAFIAEFAAALKTYGAKISFGVGDFDKWERYFAGVIKAAPHIKDAEAFRRFMLRWLELFCYDPERPERFMEMLEKSYKREIIAETGAAARGHSKARKITRFTKGLKLKGPIGPVVRSDGKLVLFNSGDSTLSIIDPMTMKEMERLETHLYVSYKKRDRITINNSVSIVAEATGLGHLFPRGLVRILEMNGWVRIDPYTGEFYESKGAPAGTYSYKNAAAITSGPMRGMTAIINSNNATISICSAEVEITSHKFNELEEPGGEAIGITFINSGKFAGCLAVARQGLNRNILIIDPLTFNIIRAIDTCDKFGVPSAIVGLPDGSLAISLLMGKSIAILDPSSGEIVNEIPVEELVVPNVYSMLFLDGSLIFCDGDAIIKVELESPAATAPDYSKPKAGAMLGDIIGDVCCRIDDKRIAVYDPTSDELFIADSSDGHVIKIHSIKEMRESDERVKELGVVVSMAEANGMIMYSGLDNMGDAVELEISPEDGLQSVEVTSTVIPLDDKVLIKRGVLSGYMVSVAMGGVLYYKMPGPAGSGSLEKDEHFAGKGLRSAAYLEAGPFAGCLAISDEREDCIYIYDPVRHEERKVISRADIDVFEGLQDISAFPSGLLAVAVGSPLSNESVLIIDPVSSKVLGTVETGAMMDMACLSEGSLLTLKASSGEAVRIDFEPIAAPEPAPEPKPELRGKPDYTKPISPPKVIIDKLAVSMPVKACELPDGDIAVMEMHSVPSGAGDISPRILTRVVVVGRDGKFMREIFNTSLVPQDMLVLPDGNIVLLLATKDSCFVTLIDPVKGHSLWKEPMELAMGQDPGISLTSDGKLAVRIVDGDGVPIYVREYQGAGVWRTGPEWGTKETHKASSHKFTMMSGNRYSCAITDDTGQGLDLVPLDIAAGYGFVHYDIAAPEERIRCVRAMPDGMLAVLASDTGTGSELNLYLVDTEVLEKVVNTIHLSGNMSDMSVTSSGTILVTDHKNEYILELDFERKGAPSAAPDYTRPKAQVTMTEGLVGYHPKSPQALQDGRLVCLSAVRREIVFIDPAKREAFRYSSVPGTGLPKELTIFPDGNIGILSVSRDPLNRWSQLVRKKPDGELIKEPPYWYDDWVLADSVAAIASGALKGGLITIGKDPSGDVSIDADPPSGSAERGRNHLSFELGEVSNTVFIKEGAFAGHFAFIDERKNAIQIKRINDKTKGSSSEYITEKTIDLSKLGLGSGKYIAILPGSYIAIYDARNATVAIIDPYPRDAVVINRVNIDFSSRISGMAALPDGTIALTDDMADSVIFIGFEPGPDPAAPPAPTAGVLKDPRTGFEALDPADDLGGLAPLAGNIVKFLRDKNRKLVGERREADEEAWKKASGWEIVSEAGDIELARLNLLYDTYAERLNGTDELSFGDFKAMLSELSGKDVSRYAARIRSAVAGVDEGRFGWVKECGVQNPRDAIREAVSAGSYSRVPGTPDITHENYLSGDRWVYSMRDPAGMSLWKLLRYYFPLDQSSKEALWREGKALGFFGLGNYTIFALFDEVFIRTSPSDPKDPGYGLINELVIVDDKDRGPVVRSWKLYHGDYTGTEIRRIRYRDTSDPDLESIFIQDSLHEYAGAVRDVTIHDDTRPFAEELDEVATVKLPGGGAEEVRLLRSRDGEYERVLADEVYVKRPDRKELRLVFNKVWERLKGAGALQIELPRSTELNMPRTDYFGSLEAAAFHLTAKAILKEFKERGVELPGYPEDYYSDDVAYDDSRARTLAGHMNKGEYDMVDEAELSYYIDEAHEKELFELLSYIEFVWRGGEVMTLHRIREAMLRKRREAMKEPLREMPENLPDLARLFAGALVSERAMESFRDSLDINSALLDLSPGEEAEELADEILARLPEHARSWMERLDRYLLRAIGVRDPVARYHYSEGHGEASCRNGRVFMWNLYHIEPIVGELARLLDAEKFSAPDWDKWLTGHLDTVVHESQHHGEFENLGEHSHQADPEVIAGFAMRMGEAFDRLLFGIPAPRELVNQIHGKSESGYKGIGYRGGGETNPSPEAPDGRPSGPSPEARDGRAFHPVPEERDSRTLQEKCPDLEKRPDLRDGQAKPGEQNAASTYGLDRGQGSRLTDLADVRTFDVYLPCMYINQGRLGDIRSGIVLAKELLRRFPDKHVRLVLNEIDVDPAKAREVLELMWPSAERSKAANLAVIEHADKSLAEPEGLPQADIGINPIIGTSRPHNFPRPRLEIVSSEYDEPNLKWVPGKKNHNIKLGLGMGRLGLLIPDEVIKKAAEPPMPKGELLDHLASSGANAAFNDAKTRSDILDSRWSAMVAHRQEHVISFIGAVKRHAKAGNKSIFFVNQSANVNRLVFGLWLAGLEGAVSVVDAEGRVIREGNTGITVYVVNAIPHSLMMPLFKSCDLPVLVTGDFTFLEAALAGSVWVYSGEPWLEDFAVSLDRIIRYRVDERIADALSDCLFFKKIIFGGVDIYAMRPLFRDPLIREKYGMIARILSEEHNFLASDAFERELARLVRRLGLSPRQNAETRSTYGLDQGQPTRLTGEGTGPTFAPPSKYDMVFFDIGKVIMNIGDRRVSRRLKLYCDKSEDEIMDEITLAKSENKRLYEKGMISPQEYFSRLKDRLGLRMEYPDFVAAYECDIAAIESTVRVMKALKAAGYKLWIISDIGLITRDYLLKNFREIFALAEGVTASCDVGVMKDDPKIFRIALEKSGADPKRSVFVDDLSGNLRTAAGEGITPLQYIDGSTDMYASLKAIIEPAAASSLGMQALLWRKAIPTLRKLGLPTWLIAGLGGLEELWYSGVIIGSLTAIGGIIGPWRPGYSAIGMCLGLGAGMVSSLLLYVRDHGWESLQVVNGRFRLSLLTVEKLHEIEWLGFLSRVSYAMGIAYLAPDIGPWSVLWALPVPVAVHGAMNIRRALKGWRALGMATVIANAEAPTEFWDVNEDRFSGKVKCELRLKYSSRHTDRIAIWVEPSGIVVCTCDDFNVQEEFRHQGYGDIIFRKGVKMALDEAARRGWSPEWAWFYYYGARPQSPRVIAMDEFLSRYGFREAVNVASNIKGRAALLRLITKYNPPNEGPLYGGWYTRVKDLPAYADSGKPVEQNTRIRLANEPKKTVKGFSTFDTKDASFDASAELVSSRSTYTLAGGTGGVAILVTCAAVVVIGPDGRPKALSHFYTSAYPPEGIEGLLPLAVPGNRFLIIPGPSHDKYGYQAAFIDGLTAELRARGIRDEDIYLHESEYRDGLAELDSKSAAQHMVATNVFVSEQGYIRLAYTDMAADDIDGGRAEIVYAAGPRELFDPTERDIDNAPDNLSVDYESDEFPGYVADIESPRLKLRERREDGPPRPAAPQEDGSYGPEERRSVVEHAITARDADELRALGVEREFALEALAGSVVFDSSYGFMAPARGVGQIELLKKELESLITEKSDARTLTIYEIGAGERPLETIQILNAVDEVLALRMPEDERSKWLVNFIVIEPDADIRAKTKALFLDIKESPSMDGISTLSSTGERVFLRRLGYRLNPAVEAGYTLDAASLERAASRHGKGDLAIHRNVDYHGRYAALGDLGIRRLSESRRDATIVSKNLRAYLAIRNILGALCREGSRYVVEPVELDGVSVTDASPVLVIPGAEIVTVNRHFPERMSEGGAGNRLTGIYTVIDPNGLSESGITAFLKGIDDSGSSGDVFKTDLITGTPVSSEVSPAKPVEQNIEGAPEGRVTADGDSVPPLPTPAIFTPEFIRSLRPKVVNNADMTRALLMRLRNAMLVDYGIGAVELGGVNLFHGLNTEDSATYSLGRLEITCFRVAEEPLGDYMIFSIGNGLATIGHGLIFYDNASNAAALRFSIHGGRLALPGRDFRNRGYGKEALALIMAACVNGKLFQDKPIDSFRIHLDVDDIPDSSEDGVMSLVSFADRHGFDEHGEFSMRDSRPERTGPINYEPRDMRATLHWLAEHRAELGGGSLDTYVTELISAGRLPQGANTEEWTRTAAAYDFYLRNGALQAYRTSDLKETLAWLNACRNEFGQKSLSYLLQALWAADRLPKEVYTTKWLMREWRFAVSAFEYYHSSHTLKQYETADLPQTIRWLSERRADIGNNSLEYLVLALSMAGRLPAQANDKSWSRYALLYEKIYQRFPILAEEAFVELDASLAWLYERRAMLGGNSLKDLVGALYAAGRLPSDAKPMRWAMRAAYFERALEDKEIIVSEIRRIWTSGDGVGAHRDNLARLRARFDPALLTHRKTLASLSQTHRFGILGLAYALYGRDVIAALVGPGPGSREEAARLFRAYRLADALKELTRVNTGDPAKDASVAKLSSDFPPDVYSDRNGWNGPGPSVEEQTALFRAIEHTLNILYDWPRYKALAPDPAGILSEEAPAYRLGDPNNDSKVKLFESGKRYLVSTLDAAMPGGLPIGSAAPAIIGIQPHILRSNRSDDLSRSPESTAGADHYLVDHRKAFNGIIENPGTEKICILTDNIGGETFLALLEAWLLLDMGKRVTVYSKQEPTLFSDTTIADLKYSSLVFDSIMRGHFGRNYSVSMADHIRAGSLKLKELPSPYLFEGEAVDGRRLVTCDFGFIGEYDLAIINGELQYGDFIRAALRSKYGSSDTSSVKSLAGLNPFPHTVLALVKTNKNHREPVVGAEDPSYVPGSPTKGEFVLQVLMPEAGPNPSAATPEASYGRAFQRKAQTEEPRDGQTFRRNVQAKPIEQNMEAPSGSGSTMNRFHAWAKEYLKAVINAKRLLSESAGWVAPEKREPLRVSFDETKRLVHELSEVGLSEDEYAAAYHKVSNIQSVFTALFEFAIEGRGLGWSSDYDSAVEFIEKFTRFRRFAYNKMLKFDVEKCLAPEDGPAPTEKDGAAYQPEANTKGPDKLSARLRVIKMIRELDEEALEETGPAIGAKFGVSPKTSNFLGSASNVKFLDRIFVSQIPYKLSCSRGLEGAEVLIMGPGDSAEEIEEFIRRYPKIGALHILAAHRSNFEFIDTTLAALKAQGLEMPAVYGHLASALSMPHYLRKRIDVAFESNLFDPWYFDSKQMQRAASGIESVLKSGGIYMPTGYYEKWVDGVMFRLHRVRLISEKGGYQQYLVRPLKPLYDWDAEKDGVTVEIKLSDEAMSDHPAPPTRGEKPVEQNVELTADDPVSKLSPARKIALPVSSPDDFRRLWVRKTDGVDTVFHSTGEMKPKFGIPYRDIEGKDIAVFGCGAGTECFWAALHGARKVTGFDMDEHSILVARTLAPFIEDPLLKDGLMPDERPVIAYQNALEVVRRALRDGPESLKVRDTAGTEFLIGDVTDLSTVSGGPVRDSSFDIVTLSGILANTNGIMEKDGMRRTIREAIRITRPGGIISIWWLEHLDIEALERGGVTVSGDTGEERALKELQVLVRELLDETGVAGKRLRRLSTAGSANVLEVVSDLGARPHGDTWPHKIADAASREARVNTLSFTPRVPLAAETYMTPVEAQSLINSHTKPAAAPVEPRGDTWPHKIADAASSRGDTWPHKIADAASSPAGVLLNSDELIPANLAAGECYVIRYDETRLRAASADGANSALKALEAYADALRTRSPNYAKQILLKPSATQAGERQFLISVERYAGISQNALIGRGVVNVPGDLKEQALDIANIFTLALATSNIPLDAKSEDLAKFATLTSMIRALYRSLGLDASEIAKAETDEGLMSVIRAILRLKPAAKLSTEELRDHYRLTIEALRRYA